MIALDWPTPFAALPEPEAVTVSVGATDGGTLGLEPAGGPLALVGDAVLVDKGIAAVGKVDGTTSVGAPVTLPAG